MKKYILKTLSVVILLTLFSCAKETFYYPLAVKSNLKFMMDKEAVKCDLVTGVVLDNGIGKSLQIMGGRGTNEVLSLMLNDYKGEGVYDFSVDAIGTFTDINAPLETIFATSGTLTITKTNDSLIIGKFNFNGENVANNDVTEFSGGTFLINTKQPAAKVDVPATTENTNTSAFFNNTEISFMGEANLVKVTKPITNNSMIIHAVNGVKMLSINLDNYSGVGTYEISVLNGNNIIYSLDFSKNVGDYTATAGKIIVTEATATNIKGTFEFDGEKSNDANNKISVKSGKFDMTFKTTTI